MKSYVSSHLKDMNRQVVFRLISEKGLTSKAEISKLTGISTPTVIKIISFLLDKGLILELGEGESAVGRKPQMLALNRDSLYSAVFFLEGEFLSLGIVDVTGEVRFRKTLNCEPHLPTVLDRISSGLIEGLFADANIDIEKMTGIGIALPGMYNPNKKEVFSAPLIGIDRPMNIAEQIRTLKNKYNVRIIVENDANCQCLGQFVLSKMPQDSDLLFISVGTGLGAGLILDGKLRRGANSMCGEVGYMSFYSDYESDTSTPGWLESHASYRTLRDKYKISKNSDLSRLPAETIESAIEDMASQLTLCINNIIMLLDCSNVRIGGVVVDILGDRLVEEINKKFKRMSVNSVIIKKQHNEDIGLIGIASMLSDEKIGIILAGE